MELPVRILFITPYPELKQQLAAIIPHYPAAKITIAEGDLGQGLIQAQRHLRPEYDAVISRGGTAELLRAAISIPVTEVEVSPYDILRALNTVGGGRAILVAHENITRSAQKLRELIDCHLEVVPLSPCSSVRDILRGLHPEGRALLCDTVAYTTALELGYHPHLVLSGDDSIRQAIDQTLLLCQARRTLSAENHFFRQLLLGQIANTVVLDDNGGLVLSSCDDLPRPLLELLRTELPVSRSMGERRILRSAGFLRRFRNRFVCRFLGGQIGRLRLCGFWIGWLRWRLRREFLRLHGLLARQQFVDHIVLQQKCRPGHERDHRQHEQRGEKAVLVPFALAAAHLALVHRARHADRLRAGRFFQCLFLLILFHGSLSIVSKLLPCIITQNRGFVNP